MYLFERLEISTGLAVTQEIYFWKYELIYPLATTPRSTKPCTSAPNASN
jgi:hypothetical protein